MSHVEQIEQQDFLKSRGWFQWYNPDYWCHQQFGNEERDCTDYGLSIDDAYEFETNPKSREVYLVAMNAIFKARKILSVIKK